MSSSTSLDGILLVDKPADVTSADVVRVVKGRLRARKVGHLGTLDPFATGLLPLCLGEGSKVVPFLNQEQKGYTGLIRLGAATDTLDATGTGTEAAEVPLLDAERLERASRRFLGEIEQVPPMYSALKRKGVRLYRLARQGVEIERPARRIRIDRFELRRVGDSALAFTVECSKGTYVRSLAADLAATLGTVGHLETLRRVRFGPFRVDEALPLDDIRPDADLPLRTPREALGDLREIEVEAAVEDRLRKGQQEALAALGTVDRPGEVVKITTPPGGLVALAEAESRRWRLVRVFRGVREVP